MLAVFLCPLIAWEYDESERAMTWAPFRETLAGFGARVAGCFAIVAGSNPAPDSRAWFLRLQRRHQRRNAA